MSKLISISPSLLESYRLTRAGMYGKTGESLAAEILLPSETNEAQSRGRAYHLLIEHGGCPYEKSALASPDKYTTIASSKDLFPGCSDEGLAVEYHVFEPDLKKMWVFSEAAAAPALSIRQRFPSMLSELKHSKIFEVSGYKVVMNMRYDGIFGLQVHEFKTKSKPPTIQEYFDSLQWRCYLLGFDELHSVHYHIFHLNEKNTTCEEFTFWFPRDATVEQLVMDNLAGFIAWLETRSDCLAKLEEKAKRLY